MSDYYDRTGRVIGLDEYASLLAMPNYKRVASTVVTSSSDPSVKYHVSTVWLGINHNWGGGDPLIFETMVFADGANKSDLDCRRYTNELDAQLGHEETVILVAATVPNEVITHGEVPSPGTTSP